MRTLALCLLLLSGCAERKPEPSPEVRVHGTAEQERAAWQDRVWQANKADSAAGFWRAALRDSIDSMRYRAALEEQRAQLAYRLQLKARGWVPVSILTHANGDTPDTLWGYPVTLRRAASLGHG